MNIEEYLVKNRDNLDLKKGRYDDIWESMVHQQQKLRRNRHSRWQLMAASVVFFLLIGLLVRHELVVQRQISDLSQINRELAAREQFYRQQVQTKWNQYVAMQPVASPMEPMLLDELKRLDTIYQQGLTELQQQGYKERLVILMLDTYEKRLHLLEQLIYEKQKQLNYENRNHNVEL